MERLSKKSLVELANLLNETEKEIEALELLHEEVATEIEKRLYLDEEHKVLIKRRK